MATSLLLTAEAITVAGTPEVRANATHTSADDFGRRGWRSESVAPMASRHFG